MQPIYKHDCDKCKFVGTYIMKAKSDEPLETDVYLQCGHDNDKFLIRFSDDPPDYYSNLKFSQVLANRLGVVS